MTGLFKSIIIFSLILVFSQTSVFAQHENNLKDRPPNVIIVLIDTLRPDHLNFYGFTEETAEFLGKLSDNSVVFKRAFSTSSWTAPSTASLFTSQYPYQNGVMEGMIANNVRKVKIAAMGQTSIPLNMIPRSIQTLPEFFKSLGYSTYGISANINISKEIGFSRGFDHFTNEHGYWANDFYNQLKKWKNKIQQSEPFLLYLHYNDVHSPYKKQDKYYKMGKLDQIIITSCKFAQAIIDKLGLNNHPRLKSINQKIEHYIHMEERAKYISEIGFFDAYFERTYQLLNMSENTILVVLSDHGEEFMEHGKFGSHGFKLYNELNQVLMLFHAPSLNFTPRYYEENVSLIDVLPTLAEIVNQKIPEDVSGTSLYPLLRDLPNTNRFHKKLQDRFIFAHRINKIDKSGQPEKQLWSTIHKNYRLIENPDNIYELYDHQRDIKEQQNIFSRHPEISSKLILKLKEAKAENNHAKYEKTQMVMDQAILGELRGLGYVQ